MTVLATLLVFFIFGLVALVVLSVVLAVLGGMLSLAGVLLFKLVPLLLLGWFVVKIFRGFNRPRDDLSAADRKWLDE
jgi:hypothetical protein